jgi:hypothetical protein
MRNIPTVLLLLLLLLLLFEIERVKEILNGRNKREDRVYKVVGFNNNNSFFISIQYRIKKKHTTQIFLRPPCFSLPSPQSKIIFLDN